MSDGKDDWTAGPWTVREGDGNYLFEVVAVTGRGKEIVVCRPAGHSRRANARLIAAAPEMLTALRRAREAVNAIMLSTHSISFDADLRAIDTAIECATKVQ